MESKVTYTLDNAPFSKFHAKVISWTTGGSFVDGYILGIIEFALVSVAAYMNMNATWQGLITSSPLVGVLIGSSILGNLADKVGRTKIYAVDFFVIFIASILQFFVNTPILLYVLRLLLGLCIGAEYAIGPTLVSEFVPSRLRGKVLSIVCMAWTVGYVAAAYAGAWMQSLGDESWRWMLASSAVVAFIVILLRLGMPESPRWLIAHGKIEEARNIVRKHLGDNVTIDSTIAEVQNHQDEQKSGYSGLFKGEQLKRTVFAAVCWGANTLPLFAILAFVPTILDSLGIKDANTFYTLILNGVLLFACIIAMFLVDRFSRKRILVGGMLVACIPLFMLGLWAQAPAWIIIACFAFHLVGGQIAGTIAAYIYPVECFPTELRASGAGFSSAISRVFGIVGTFFVPVMIAGAGIGVALIGMGIVLVIALVMALAWAPESTGVSIDEL